MSRSFVNPHSVQAQFANLNNECESLRHSTTVTNNERRQEENLIKKLLQEQRTLTNQIRIAHTNLGAENKKRQLLEDEMKRLRDILRSDRKHILDITSELLGLKDEEKNRKRKFVEEMNDCNNDLEMGLQSYQNKNFLNMISTKTVKMLIDVILEKELDKEKKQNKENFQASAEVDCLNVSTKWKDLDTRMRESHELIKEASSKMRRELNHRQKLKSDISKLRFKVLKGAESIDDTREVRIYYDILYLSHIHARFI